jgi:hypothetical protein
MQFNNPPRKIQKYNMTTPRLIKSISSTAGRARSTFLSAMCAVVGLLAFEMPARAALEFMQVSGTGGQTLFTSSDVIDGRSVNTSVNIIFTVLDGPVVVGDPTTLPVATVSVTQTDAVTSASLFEGIAYSTFITLNLGAGLDSAHLQSSILVTSLIGADSRQLDLNIVWGAADPLQTLSFLLRNAEDGNIQREQLDATARLANSTGNVQLSYPGTQGHVLTLTGPSNPTMLWNTLCTGARRVRPERGGTGSNAFTLPLATTSSSSGYWSGYWTWNYATRTWYWTWVWNCYTCLGWQSS